MLNLYLGTDFAFLGFLSNALEDVQSFLSLMSVVLNSISGL
jgi:hypothetical protein